MGSQKIDKPLSNLPLALTSFVGRRRELAEVKSLLKSTRLLTLTGPGGCGKTRLALAVADELLAEFDDGVWLVELAALNDPTLVLQTVAGALGLREWTTGTRTQALSDYLHLKNLLLILDNCEHLVNASAQLAEQLLRVCPDLKILATSRESLAVGGEAVYLVPTLSLPEPNASSPVKVLESEAVRLFVERARAVKIDFGLTAENAPIVAQICQRLDGIPLAIELAAARTKLLKVDHLAKRLDDRFNLLTTGSRTALPRQQTLRATIDWSYDLLPEPARAMFRRLSVFAGGFTLNAAEQICSDESAPPPVVLEMLALLVDRSLVIVEARREEERYRQLETIRVYAREKLIESNEADRMRRRHFDFFLAFVEASEPDPWGAAEQVWLDRLEAEQDNLRAALQWSLERGDFEQLLRLAGALGWFWYVRSNFVEGRRWLDQALAHSDTCIPAVRVKGLHRAGALAALQGDYVRASEFFSAQSFYDASGSSRGRAWVLHQLSIVAFYRGNYAEAIATARDSLLLFKQIGKREGIANEQLYIGIMAYYQGDDAQAKELIEQCLPVLQEIGDSVAVARAFHTLGLVARRRGDLAEARTLFEKSLNMAQEKGSRLDVAQAFEGLAGVACAQGQSESAVRLFAAAETVRQVIGAPLPPGIRMDYERDLAMTRAQLDSPTFEEAWAAGRKMTLEQAAEHARATTVQREPPRTPRQAAKELYGGLTAREREIAVLVAQGKSNRQIAELLVISERTVTTHVANILSKLGFSSRAQIAAWVAAQGLVYREI
jgi:predicted ATPase/DNA-binding CsgD family transcriptional regulator